MICKESHTRIKVERYVAKIIRNNRLHQLIGEMAIRLEETARRHAKCFFSHLIQQTWIAYAFLEFRRSRAASWRFSKYCRTLYIGNSILQLAGELPYAHCVRLLHNLEG